MPRRRRTRRPESLAGTHLHLDERTGLYVWRRTDPITGRPRKRSTGERVLVHALARAAEFEQEHDQRRRGIVVVDGWGRELAPLVEDWLAHQRENGEALEPTLKGKRGDALRALERLRLRRCADLTDVAGLHERLMALGEPRRTLRREYQDVLRQFAAWLAGNNRVLDRDPLAAWEPIQYERGETRDSRAMEPEEVARALLALDRLALVHGRKDSQRLLFVALLVVGSRVEALLEREVPDLRPDEGRLYLGESVGKKRRGPGLVDPTTLEELRAYVGKRTSGPLFLSPDGARPTRERTFDTWREAFGLAVTEDLWPADEPRHDPPELVLLVAQALATGRARVSKGGNPKRVKRETLEARRALERRVLALADRLRDAWTHRMAGVTLQSFRVTHRTWALAAGVPEVVIDKTLGHAAGATEPFDVLRSIAGSPTGRRYYTDLRSKLIDASRSAVAVRELLDEALAAVVSEWSVGQTTATGTDHSQA